jgi:RNA polymerase sigma-70 factor (ECF subfamily)
MHALDAEPLSAASRRLPAQAAAATPSFEEVYEAHVEWVWRSLRRLGVPEASVDDALQDVFVVVHRRLGDFEGRSSLKTWLFGIVLGTARNHRRSARRRAPETRLAAEVNDDLPARDARGPEDCAEDAEAVRVLHALLDELPEDKREVFVLADLEEMSAPEIAAALDLNLNTVYSRIRAARLAFEQAVARYHTKEASCVPKMTSRAR